jgi:hypothetical protein
VSEKERPRAAERLTEAFGEPYREVVRNAVDANRETSSSPKAGSRA